MSFARARALRSLQSSLRTRASPIRTQLVAKRFASGGAHDSHKASSDVPWAIGAVVVTIPSAYFLWPDTTHAEAGHHGEHHAEEHKEEHKDEEEPKEEEPKEEEPKEEEPKEEDESKEVKEKSEDSDKAEKKPEPAKEEKKDDEKDESKDEGADKKSEGSSVGKGKVAEDSDANKQTSKSEDDNKGASKKRVDSAQGKTLGEGSSSGTHSGKQEGLSNTDTKHSVQIDEKGAEKSTKSEGAPETAKIKGPVDPSRPAR